MDISNINAERALWDSFTRGSTMAFGNVYKNYSGALFQYGLKITTDTELIKDSIQDLFTSLWENRGKKSEVIHIKAYLLKSLRYIILQKIRTLRSVRYTEDYDHVNVELSKETQIILNEIDLHKTYELRKLISTLSQKQKEVIHLKYYHNLTIEQIAHVLCINKQSVSNLLYRALGSLKKHSQKKLGRL